MANEYNYPVIDGDQDMYHIFLGFEFWSYFGFGRVSPDTSSGAVRFPAVALTQGQSIISATLNMYVEGKGSGSGTDLKYRIEGMDEDNTAALDASYPLGRPSTTAVTTGQVSLPSAGSGFGVNVKSIVEEIIGRGGWSSGNAIGFKCYDDGTTANNIYFYDNFTGTPSQDPYLEILTTTRPDFYPSETVVVAPTEVLTTSNFGIKIAKRGISVLEATDKQLIFSTKRPILKAELYGIQNVDENVITNIPHKLGYKGAFLVWAAPVSGDIYSSLIGKRKKVPAAFYDSVKSEVNLSAYIDNDNLYIQQGGVIQDGALSKYHVYFYIFLDDIDI